jgi:hypothetical protein
MWRRKIAGYFMSNLPLAEPQESFIKVELNQLPAGLRDLHQRVVGQTGRIELRDGDGPACVLISKSELDALERALDILSQTKDVRDMRDELSRLVFSADKPASA